LAKRERFGVVNSLDPYASSKWRLSESSKITTTFLGATGGGEVASVVMVSPYRKELDLLLG
jgi:hypothetical protein